MLSIRQFLLELFQVIVAGNELYGTILEGKTPLELLQERIHLFILKSKIQASPYFRKHSVEKKLSPRERDLRFLLLSGLSDE